MDPSGMKDINAAQASFSMSSGSGAAGDFISSASPFVIGAF